MSKETEIGRERIMKTYNSHEFEYQRMRKQGIVSWDRRNNTWEIDPSTQRFIDEVLEQEWCPQKGRVLELGCGTGPLLRWLTEKGFSGLGIDISATAIEMAKEQSHGLALDYIVGDICKERLGMRGSFDLCLDGHLMHCICDPEDRYRILHKVADVLSDDGVFLLMSMCAPIDEAAFERLYAGQILRDNIIYCPTGSPASFEDACTIDGNHYLPTRRIPDWQALLTEINEANLQPLLVRFSHATPREPVSALNVAVKKRT